MAGAHVPRNPRRIPPRYTSAINRLTGELAKDLTGHPIVDIEKALVAAEQREERPAP